MLSLYFFCFDQIVKMTVADMIFNIDLFDMHFFYLQSSSTGFSMKLIAPDLLVSWIQQ